MSGEIPPEVPLNTNTCCFIVGGEDRQKDDSFDFKPFCTFFFFFFKKTVLQSNNYQQHSFVCMYIYIYVCMYVRVYVPVVVKKFEIMIFHTH